MVILYYLNIDKKDRLSLNFYSRVVAYLFFSYKRIYSFIIYYNYLRAVTLEVFIIEKILIISSSGLVRQKSYIKYLVNSIS